MKVIVSYLGKSEEYTSKFTKQQEAYLDAAKQAMKNLDPTQPRNVSVILQCCRKGTKRSHFYNTYFVLLAAGMAEEADRIRSRFKTQFDIDLAKEPARA
jgi:hypothetical protein